MGELVYNSLIGIRIYLMKNYWGIAQLRRNFIANHLITIYFYTVYGTTVRKYIEILSEYVNVPLKNIGWTFFLSPPVVR